MGKSEKDHVQGIAGFLGSFLASLESREREVIRARYGLDGSEPVTLQAIGNRYRVTRERIRQIEAHALSELHSKLNESYVKRLAEGAVSRLKSVGGVEREESFMEALKGAMGERAPLPVFANSAHFLLELSGKVFRYGDRYSDWHPYWYAGESDRKRGHAFVGQFLSTLRSRRQEVVNEKKFHAVLASAARSARVPEAVAQNYVSLSKHFVSGPFSDLGLREWEEVNPRTARDWAYAVLKRERRPLHFTELAKIIANHRKHKATNLQTIHNELIKDDRFVLVGRGLYGLSEFGLIPGTAREMIFHVLKQLGPLHPKEVVNRVKEQRFLKEATILINLQNRKHFLCLPDGRYCLRQA